MAYSPFRPLGGDPSIEGVGASWTMPSSWGREFYKKEDSTQTTQNVAAQTQPNSFAAPQGQAIPAAQKPAPAARTTMPSGLQVPQPENGFGPRAMGPVRPDPKEIERIMNMSDQEFFRWKDTQGGGDRPGSWGQAMLQARQRAKAGIPPGAVRVPDQWMEGKGWIKGGWRLPGGQMWDPSKGPAPEPRRFPWSTPQEAPKKDWEAIEDFKQTIGYRRGQISNIKKALEYPDMVNQAIGGSVTITNLTPELLSSLKSQGYDIKTFDFDKTGKLGSIKFGSGVEALNALEKLKATGAVTELSDFKNIIAFGRNF